MSNIEWTEATLNPTTGCDKISPGCDNCYALTMAKRLKDMGQAKYQNDGNSKTSGPGFALTVHPDVLTEPLRWKKPRKVFVNSMSDLFHARVPADFITRLWRTMQATPQHTYQILTKRASRLEPVLTKVYADLGIAEPLPNVWLGTSVETQKYADLRIPGLLQAPAAIRFLSCEPLLGPLNLTHLPLPSRQRTDIVYDALTQQYGVPGLWHAPTAARIDWVIVGGESGPGARPMNPDWAADIVSQCQYAHTAVFVKQLGSVWARDWTVNGKTVAAHGDTKGGNPDYWPAHLRVREYPTAAAHV